MTATMDDDKDDRYPFPPPIVTSAMIVIINSVPSVRVRLFAGSNSVIAKEFLIVIIARSFSVITKDSAVIPEDSFVSAEFLFFIVDCVICHRRVS